MIIKIKEILLMLVVVLVFLGTWSCQSKGNPKKQKAPELGDTIAFEIQKDSLNQYVELIWVNDTMLLMELLVENQNPYARYQGDGLSCGLCNHLSKYSKEEYTNSKGQKYSVNKFILCQYPDVIDSTGMEFILKVEENSEFAIVDTFVNPRPREGDLPFTLKTEMPKVKTRPKDPDDE